MITEIRQTQDKYCMLPCFIVLHSKYSFSLFTLTIFYNVYSSQNFCFSLQSFFFYLKISLYASLIHICIIVDFLKDIFIRY